MTLERKRQGTRRRRIKSISTNSAPAAVGPYSQAIEANGFVFCSGQLGLDPKTGQLAADDVAGQAAQALENIAVILAAAGSGINKVVKATVFIVDIKEFSSVNDVYASAFSVPFPARSCVEVSALPKGAKVEIEVVAVL